MKYKSPSIFIATGIYSPDIGGPAQYAEMLVEGFRAHGERVEVASFGSLMRFPSGIRHLFYFCKILPYVSRADTVIILDTFSAALPALWASRLLGKKTIVRVGGDFLWEAYVERTREPVLLSQFYKEIHKGERHFNRREKNIFSLTRWVFRHADAVVFSTIWQRDIMAKPYKIDAQKTHFIENKYDMKHSRNVVPKRHVILSPSRNRFLKNKAGLQAAFEQLKKHFFDIELDTNVSNKNELIRRMSEAYCLVVPSFSEVSPNIVIDAVTLGVPVVCTEDCGIRSRLGEAVVWVDTRAPESIARGIERLLDAAGYEEQLKKISNFDFVHSTSHIIDEFLSVMREI